MDLTLAGISAFRFYRVPPQVLALLPPVAQARDYGRRGLYGHPLVGEALGGTPLTCLATARRQSTGARWINWTLVQGELPFGHVLDTDFSIGVTSPALTLITLGRKLSVTRLAMAAYELTGYFSVFCPSDEMEEALASNAGMLRDSGVRSWHRVPREDGRRGDLWQRAPLADLDELASFARVNAKLRGAGKLAEALSLVNGVVASPFEARLSFLMPREGLSPTRMLATSIFIIPELLEVVRLRLSARAGQSIRWRGRHLMTPIGRLPCGEWAST